MEICKCLASLRIGKTNVTYTQWPAHRQGDILFYYRVQHIVAMPTSTKNHTFTLGYKKYCSHSTKMLAPFALKKQNINYITR